MRCFSSFSSQASVYFNDAVVDDDEILGIILAARAISYQVMNIFMINGDWIEIYSQCEYDEWFVFYFKVDALFLIPVYTF